MLEVPVQPAPVSAMNSVIGGDRAAAVEAALGNARRALSGRTVWHVNSTAAGGGVAEMLPRRHDRFESLFHDAALDEHPTHPLARTTQREEETYHRLSRISRNRCQASAGTV